MHEADVTILLTSNFDFTFFLSVLLELEGSNLEIVLLIGPEVSETLLYEDIFHYQIRTRIQVRRFSRAMLLFPHRTSLLVSTSSGLHLSRHFIISEKRYHIPHSLISLHMGYPKGAFEFYNSIFSAAKHQDQEFAYLKNHEYEAIIPSGYTKFDVMYKKIEECDDQSNSIFIGPSWHPDGLNWKFWHEILSLLTDSGYKALVRFHPMTHKLEKHSVDEFMLEFAPATSVLFENPARLISSGFYSSNLMIGDFSGLSFEYALFSENPVISIGSSLKILNPQYLEMSMTPVEIKFRDQLGLHREDANPQSVVRAIHNHFSGSSSIAVNLDKSTFLHERLPTAASQIANHILETLEHI